MERNDFWTHMGVVFFSFFGAVLPEVIARGSVVYLYTGVYLIGAIIILTGAIIAYSRTRGRRPA